MYYLKSVVMNASIYLYYTIFADYYDVICRHTEIVNHRDDKSIYYNKVMSFSMDFADSDYDVMTLSGAHLYEKKYLSRRAIKSDSIVLESIRGTSSPQATPFIALMDKNANEDIGSVWAFNFIYSGDL